MLTLSKVIYGNGYIEMILIVAQLDGKSFTYLSP